jgi:glycogenin glucosyltransferase
MLTSAKDLDFGFEVWKKNQDAIVGFKSNSHSSSSDNTKLKFIENFDKTNRFSMIESKSMFIRTDYLYAYTCLIPEEIHYYIDQHPMCYDIAMNMLVSGMSGVSPVLVKASFLFEFEEPQQSQLDYNEKQSQCLNELATLFDGKTTLKYNNEIVTRISSKNTPSSPVPWDTWSEYIKRSTIA